METQQMQILYVGLDWGTNPRPITLELLRLTITPQMRLI